MEKKKFYVPVKIKFLFCLLLMLIWLCFSLFICFRWINNMEFSIPLLLAIIIAFMMGIVPSLMSTLTLGGVIVDKPRVYEDLEQYPHITILIPCHNGENTIYKTIQYIAQQEYAAKIFIKVIDNHSTDNTMEEIYRAKTDFQDKQVFIQYRYEGILGKHNAMNYCIPEIGTKYFVTVDDDTILYQGTLKKLVNHIVYENKNKKVGAVSGCVLVRNSRTNLLTKLQEHDFYLNISSLKRAQNVFSTTLVAPGACSIYKTKLVRQLNGYSDSIVEDLLLSYGILHSGELLQFEPSACAFTEVPETWKSFFIQRIRWSRGAIEAWRVWKPWTFPHYTKFFICLDYLMLLVPWGVWLFFVPGIFLALIWHNYLIVGLFTLLTIPISIIVNLIQMRKQWKYVFHPMGLKVRKHYLSLIFFIFFYTFILHICSIIGQVSEIFKRKRQWNADLVTD